MCSIVHAFQAVADGESFTYPKPEWFAEALGSSYVASWVGAHSQPHWYRPAALGVRAPLAHQQSDKHPGVDHDGDIAVASDLEREIEIYRRMSGVRLSITEVHWSAGVTSLSEPALRRIHAATMDHFKFVAGAGFTACVAVPTRHKMLLPILRDLGVTTLQTAVANAHPQYLASVGRLIAAAHEGGFRAIGVNFPVDLPSLPKNAVRKSMAALTSYRPTRILLTSDSTGFPPRGRPATVGHDNQSQRHWREAVAVLIGAGYGCVANNLFALHSDEYAKAQRLARLVLRPYGYSSFPADSLIALGQGSIGNIGPLQYQNCRHPGSYAAMLERGALPIERGFLSRQEDIMRRTIIAELLTNFAVNIEVIESCFNIDFIQTFRDECKALERLERERLVEVQAGYIRLTTAGRFSCGRIAKVFDRYTRVLADTCDLI